MTQTFWILTVSLALLIIVTRGLPFLMSGLITERVTQLGKLLPAYIMMLLVIYEVNLKTIMTPPYGLPAFVALGSVLIAHLWIKSTFLSLFVGTGCFIVLNYWFV